jgi:hypothetical protein
MGMENRVDGSSVSGGTHTTTVAVDIDPELERALEALPDARGGNRGHEWTPAEDAALRRYWGVKRQADVARHLGVSENVCRDRYRKLSGKEA